MELNGTRPIAARFRLFCIVFVCAMMWAGSNGPATAQSAVPSAPSIVAPYLDEEFDAGGAQFTDKTAVAMARMARALEAHDLGGFLRLHTYGYFREQMGVLLSAPKRPNAYAALNQYSCEFLYICGANRSYVLEDITKARLLRFVPGDGGLIEVTWRLTMEDGAVIESSFFFDTGLGGFFAALG